MAPQYERRDTLLRRCSDELKQFKDWRNELLTNDWVPYQCKWWPLWFHYSEHTINLLLSADYSIKKGRKLQPTEMTAILKWNRQIERKCKLRVCSRACVFNVLFKKEWKPSGQKWMVIYSYCCKQLRWPAAARFTLKRWSFFFLFYRWPSHHFKALLVKQ